jgi:hypothetical protein
MMFSLDVRRAGKGDCLLLHYGTTADPRVAVIDGGPARTYAEHLEPRLRAIAAARALAAGRPLPLDLVMISHIDDDHITGILDLTRTLVTAQDAHRPAPVKIRGFWHNSFDDILGNNPQELTNAVTTRFGPASLAGEPDVEGLNDVSAKVLASVSQGIRLRDDARKLSLRLNPPFDGGLVMAMAGGGAIDMGDGLSLTVAGPMKPQLLALQKQHDQFLTERKEKGVATPLAEFTDTSVPNLSSIVVVAELEGKRILLTGDARGDIIVQGLELVGLLARGKTLTVDVLKMPHHGSSRNMEPSFLRRIRARHYVFSGNGEHGNPERETLEMLRQARPDGEYELHLTYPVAEIDVERRKDWEKEQGKEIARSRKNPRTAVRRDWSPGTNSLAAFFAAHSDMARRVRVVDAPGPHVIDLLEPLGF